VATASLVHVDCDIYSAVRYAIGVARSKLRGGYLVFDDVLHGSCLGAMQAVEEELYHREKLVAEQVFPHLVFRYPAVLEAEPADSVRVLPIPAPSVSPVPAIASPEAPKVDELQWTGERFVPGMPGGIRYEHLHRYALCRHLVAGKHVLDIASGEGYGSAALAGWAASVVGVDIDDGSIRHARQKYGRLPNLSFRKGSADAIPIGDDEIEVAVCFETIEHLGNHQGLLGEIRRVLAPD
jgi:2-polyprenyl-3-methyl-5-hydroxy-6-metoxy-1,4-benzoquinol methylase